MGFDWHPATDELWFTDNGRDMMGDDVPPDELEPRAARPACTSAIPTATPATSPIPSSAGSTPARSSCRRRSELGPHVAAIGMRFYTGTMFPAAYRNQIFIAEHGSWNRSTPIGYRVMMVRLAGGQAVSYEPFAEGWLERTTAWGRPVDVEVMPDGALLVSDDNAGAIYRITYAATMRSPRPAASRTAPGASGAGSSPRGPSCRKRRGGCCGRLSGARPGRVSFHRGMPH